MSCYNPIAVLFNSSGSEVCTAKNTDGTVTLGTHTHFNRSPSLDAFGRLRTSKPQTLFDSKQISSEQTQYWHASTTSASITYVKAHACSVLSASATQNATAIRQSKRYFNYQPGKSLASVMSFNMNGISAACSKKIGYFDANDGIFLELSGTSAYMVQRSSTGGSPVNTKIAQADWNMDTMDGNGPSMYDIDWTKTQILQIDLEWLGVGAVRTGFVINGNLIYAHEFRNANTQQFVYMQTPNLPVRQEVVNLAGGGTNRTMDAICCSVMSEDGVDAVGYTRVADRGGSGYTLSTSPPKPLIGIRLQSNHNRAAVQMTGFDLMVNGNANFKWFTSYDPVIPGASNWIKVSGSSVEYNIASTGSITTIANSGTVVESGYGSQATRIVSATPHSLLQLYSSIDGNTRGTFYLFVQPLNGTNIEYYGAISWLELT